jgi:hypothetical protein
MAMKEFIKKHLFVNLISLAGGIAGFLYWKFIGCASGTCMIKSVWYMSTLYGLLLGYLTGSLTEELYLKFKNKRKI